MNGRFTLFFLLVLGLIITACDKTPASSGHRIVSLSPAMTEVIYSLQTEDKLVGTTTFCNYPAAARDKPKVGDFSNPSIERILALKPSLVILTPPEQNRIKTQLEQFDIQVFISAPASLDSLFQEIRSLAALIGKKAAGDSLIKYMTGNLTADRPTGKKVYVEISSRPIITIGRPTFLNELISRAGAVNIFNDINDAYPVIDQETIIKRNPQAIIILHPEKINDRTGWQQIDAVKNNDIFYDIDPDLLLRPGPRLVQGYRKLQEILHD